MHQGPRRPKRRSPWALMEQSQQDNYATRVRILNWIRSRTGSQHKASRTKKIKWLFGDTSIKTGSGIKNRSKPQNTSQRKSSKDSTTMQSPPWREQGRELLTVATWKEIQWRSVRNCRRWQKYERQTLLSWSVNEISRSMTTPRSRTVEEKSVLKHLA